MTPQPEQSNHFLSTASSSTERTRMRKNNEKIPTSDLTPDVQVLMQKHNKHGNKGNLSPPKTSSSTAKVSKRLKLFHRAEVGGIVPTSSYKDITNKEKLVTNSPA